MDYTIKKLNQSEVANNIIGAVWVRIMNDYGHIDDETDALDTKRARL